MDINNFEFISRFSPSTKFIDNNKRVYIKNFIKNNILINLNLFELEQILLLFYNLIEYISKRFSFDENLYDKYWFLLIENNHKDLIGLFNLLLPYINDDNKFALHKKIFKLTDITNKKVKDDYIISNIQHNLYNNILYDYSINDIIINYNLLLNTIDIVSNKLYINWINIRPICLSKYKDTNLYKNTFFFIRDDKKIILPKNNNVNLYFFKLKLVYYDENNMLTTPDILSRDFLNYKGLSFSDIFNTIYYDLFYDIYDIKWFIYQGIFENNDEIYIKKFNEHIAIYTLYIDMKWELLTNDEQYLFNSKLLNFYNLALSNNSYFNLLKYIIIFFERNYPMFYIIDKNYIKITSKTDINIIDDDDDNNDDFMNNININEFIENVKNIPIEHLYNYFLISIQKFKNTWYGKQIILDNTNIKNGVYIDNLDKIKFNYNSYVNEYIDKNIHLNIMNNIKEGKIIFDYQFDYKKSLPDNLYVKYKFFYNYAKAFVIIYLDKTNNLKTFERIKWFNMNKNDRINMIKLFNYSYIESLDKKSDISKNLNTMSFLKYYNMIYDNDTVINEYINYISTILYDLIQLNIINIIFEILIYKGLLSQFIFDDNKKLTENSLIEYNKDAYYFITNDIYDNLNNNQNFFNLLIKKYNWYTSYCLNWISQINFYHKYINNRIIFLTGSTGVGKSTQIPKLLLYSLKMIDKKINGKIICSQPRIAPTKNIANRIANELGVPIFKLFDNKLLSTSNPYVQYNTKNESYNVNNHYDLYLKIVTDKLLLIELLNNPIFKKIIKRDNDINDLEYNVYTKNNLYDIIIIDESHEHNLNMDLILTIVRDTIKINNSLKLIITSATMQDDERIYRYYYKEIDDNLSYPYNFYNSENNLTRWVVDRRIHISAPNETTKFNIYESYLDFEPNNYDDAENLGYDKLNELLRKKIYGHVLFFTISVEQIKKLVKKINDYIETNYPKSEYICLPYFRQLSKKWEIFDNLEDKLSNININRTDIYDIIFENKKNYKLNRKKYKYVIIVATNIAEASITINNLKYVIDTGYFILVKNDPLTNLANINISKISEVSRIQRKGRIGRVSNGTIYYMYKEHSRKNIMPNYEICNKSLHFELYELTNNNKNDKFLIPNFYSTIYNINFNNNNLDELINTFPYLKKSNILEALIRYQYIYINKWLPNSLSLLSKDQSSYDYDILINKLFLEWNCKFDKNIVNLLISNRYPRYITGYDIKNSLFDIDGKFYIIHPDENNIIRNRLNGDIISIKNITHKKKNSYFISYKIFIFINKCIKYNLLIDNNLYFSNNENTIQNNNYTIFKNIEFNLEKTIFGRIIYSLNKIMNFLYSENPDINLFLLNTIIYSCIYDIDNIIILIISLLYISNYDINFFNHLNIDLYNIEDKDLYIYFYIAHYLYDKLNIEIKNKILLSKINNLIDINKINFINQKRKIILKSKNNLILNIEQDIYNKFNSLYNENKLHSLYDNYDISNYIDIIYNNELFKSNINIFKYILNDNLNNNIIDDFFNYYYYIKFKLDHLKKNNLFIWFKNNVPVIKSFNNISTLLTTFNTVKYCFLYGFSSYNTLIYNNNNNKYTNIHLYNDYENISINTKTILSKYIVYLIENKNLPSIIFNTDKDILIKINLTTYYPINIKLQSNIIFKDIYNSIRTNRFKYLKHLNTCKYIRNINNNDIFNQPNNLVKFILKLWSKNY